MRSTTTMRWQRITAACSIISIASALGLASLHRGAAERAAAWQASQADASQAQATERFLRNMVGGAQDNAHAPRALAEAYARTLVAVRELAPPRLIALQSLTVAQRQIPIQGVALAQLSEPIAGTLALRRIKVELKGRYASLADLMAYLDGVRTSPAVIRSIDIARDQFAAELLILGL